LKNLKVRVLNLLIGQPLANLMSLTIPAFVGVVTNKPWCPGMPGFEYNLMDNFPPLLVLSPTNRGARVCPDLNII